MSGYAIRSDEGMPFRYHCQTIEVFWIRQMSDYAGTTIPTINCITGLTTYYNYTNTYIYTELL